MAHWQMYGADLLAKYDLYTCGTCLALYGEEGHNCPKAEVICGDCLYPINQCQHKEK
jgi:hypothetical protein